MDDLQKKLDELIILRDTLSELTSNFDLSKLQLVDTTSEYTGKIQFIVQQHQLEIKDNNEILSQKMAKVEQLIRSINIKFEHKNNKSITKSIDSLNLLINKINNDIAGTNTELVIAIALDNIRNLCTKTEYNQKFLEICLPNSTIIFSNEMLDLILLKIRSNCDWRYPGLQINTISKDWIDSMVAADPLYLVNLNTHASDTIIDSYPIPYQHRLRIYNILNQEFSILPQEQFGCIVCCDFLNLFNVTTIKNYLIDFFNLLRPGGILISTIRLLYNSTNLVESDYFKYASNLIIQKLFKDIGYENILLIDLISINDSNQECIFVIEARRPGILTTTKAHQVLGSIITK